MSDFFHFHDASKAPWKQAADCPTAQALEK